MGTLVGAKHFFELYHCKAVKLAEVFALTCCEHQRRVRVVLQTWYMCSMLQHL
jgi:predicted ArsR family transcriptional regulator